MIRNGYRVVIQKNAAEKAAFLNLGNKKYFWETEHQIWETFGKLYFPNRLIWDT